MWTIFKVFIEFVEILFQFFSPEAYGILASQPGIKPVPPALEDEVLTTGPLGQSLLVILDSVPHRQIFQ